MNLTQIVRREEWAVTQTKQKLPKHFSLISAWRWFRSRFTCLIQMERTGNDCTPNSWNMYVCICGIWQLQYLLITPKVYAYFSIKYVKYYFIYVRYCRLSSKICKNNETKLSSCAWHKLITSCQLVAMCRCPILR